MIKIEAPIISSIYRIAGRVIFALGLISLTAPSFASNAADCIKFASGYNAVKTATSDGKLALKFVYEHSECVPTVLSMRPEFIALTGAVVIAKGSFGSEGNCKAALTGPAKKALASALKKSLEGILPASAISKLQSIADGKSNESLSSIPVLGEILNELPCACAVAYSGLSATDLPKLIKQELYGVQACASLLEDAGKAVTDAVGLTCSEKDKKISQAQYIERYLMPSRDHLALASNKTRYDECFGPHACNDRCSDFYQRGSKACRMSKENSHDTCNKIVATFGKIVMDRQPVLVAQALVTCTAMGDGCAPNKDYPKMVIDTYGEDTMKACLGILQNTYKTSNCNPNEQPCCWRAPWPPELKCKKARAEAASRLGDLGSQIAKSFSVPSTAYCTDKTIADRNVCLNSITKNALYYLQNEACAAAAKTPTDDFSRIWPEVIKAAKARAAGDAYAKCDAPYVKECKSNMCRNTVCAASSATLKTVYNSTGPAAQDMCYNDCMSGMLATKMNDAGHQRSQTVQQSTCVANCQVTCRDYPNSMDCKNCSKPNWCGSGASSNSGSGGGSSKPAQANKGGGNTGSGGGGAGGSKYTD